MLHVDAKASVRRKRIDSLVRELIELRSKSLDTKTKKASEQNSLAFSFCKSLARLHESNVFSSWAFRAAAFREGDALSFSEIVVAHAIQVGRVKEHVLTSARIDESEALVCQPFDRTFCHLNHSSSKKSLSRCRSSQSVQAARPHAEIVSMLRRDRQRSQQPSKNKA